MEVSYVNNEWIITRRQLHVSWIVLLLKILYELSVQLLLSERYLLWSFNKEINWQNIIFELVFFVIGALIYIVHFDGKSSYCFFLTLLFVLYYIPTNSTMVLSNVSWNYYLMTNVFALLFMYAMGRMMSHEQKKKRNVNIVDESEDAHSIIDEPAFWWAVRLVMIFVCIVTIIYVYSYNGLNLSIIFSSMYSTRAEYARYAEGITGSLLSYITLIATRLATWFLPLYLFFSLTKRKIIDVVFCVFTFVAQYTVEMQKSTLMIIGVVILIAIIEKKKEFRKSSLTMLYVFVGMFASIFVEYFITKQSLIFNVFVRRVFYIPAYMTQSYYEFFKSNPKLLFTQDCFFVQNILQRIMGRAYSSSAVSVISKNCFNGELASPNTGLFAEAFAQIGVVGIAVFPIIYCYITRFMKSVASFYGKGATYVVMLRLVLTLVSVFALTSSTFIGVILFGIMTYVAKVLYYNFRRNR